MALEKEEHQRRQRHLERERQQRQQELEQEREQRRLQQEQERQEIAEEQRVQQRYQIEKLSKLSLEKSRREQDSRQSSSNMKPMRQTSASGSRISRQGGHFTSQNERNTSVNTIQMLNDSNGWDG
jgi:hypothetical protein